MWQTKTSATHRCYGGALTTAGNLLFTGRTDGSFVAQDVTNGNELWSTKLQYGADAPPMTYTVNGRQYVAIFDGGSIIGSGKGYAGHGDEVSVFAVQYVSRRTSRDAGSRGGRPSPSAACGLGPYPHHQEESPLMKSA